MQDKLSKRVLAAVPPLRWAYNRYTFWKSSERHFKRFQGKNAREVFTSIYEENHWGSEGSASGLGSELEATTEIRRVLPQLFRELKISSVLDIPCGDFFWMKHVDLSGVQYTGADVVQALVGKNNAQFGKPGVEFRVINLLEDKLPKVDLIFCRDCLIHFSDEDVWRALRNVAASGSKYLLTTNYPARVYNKAMITGDFRQINLLAHPFKLPEPKAFYKELWRVEDPKYADRGMALWDVESLAQFLKA